MKTKTIEVSVPDFCPEDCPEFELEKTVYESMVDSFVLFSCRHAAFCERTHMEADEYER